MPLEIIGSFVNGYQVLMQLFGSIIWFLNTDIKQQTAISGVNPNPNRWGTPFSGPMNGVLAEIHGLMCQVGD